MQDQLELQNTVNRIMKMEQYFDIIQNAINIDPDILNKDDDIKIMLQDLIQYYESGQWFADYECDERGELPQDLKRGILSEDAIYNLLCDISARE